MQSDEQLRDESAEQVASSNGRLVTRRVGELRAHPSYVRHGLAVSAAQLSALEERGDLAFRSPVLTTTDGTVIDGYARWKLAQLKGRTTLLCIVYELNETDALQYLLQKHLPSTCWNAFTRILLALDLELGLKGKALSNQCVGGQNKGLSKLTNPERVHVRSEIAAAANVCPGNVDKVKHLKANAIPELLQALRNGEVSIHRAWKWSKESPEEQREALWRFQSERGLRKTIRNLVSPCKSKSSPSEPEVSDLIKLSSAVQSGKLGPVRVISVSIPGKAVFVTKELFRTLAAQEELALTCATDNR